MLFRVLSNGPLHTALVLSSASSLLFAAAPLLGHAFALQRLLVPAAPGGVDLLLSVFGGVLIIKRPLA